MRAVLSIVLVSVLLAVTSLDGIACPDGCTDGAPASFTTAAPACTACQGWGGPSAVVSLPLASSTPAYLSATLPRPETPFLPALDPPPKHA